MSEFKRFPVWVQDQEYHDVHWCNPKGIRLWQFRIGEEVYTVEKPMTYNKAKWYATQRAKERGIGVIQVLPLPHRRIL